MAFPGVFRPRKVGVDMTWVLHYTDRLSGAAVCKVFGSRREAVAYQRTVQLLALARLGTDLTAEY
jgi:hypothetical protein